jgi:hypothetical protein
MNGQILVKFFITKFCKYLFSGFRVIKFVQTDRETDGGSYFNKRSTGMQTSFILAGIAYSDICTSYFPNSSVSITRTTTFYHANFAIVKYCRISPSVSRIHCCMFVY